MTFFKESIREKPLSFSFSFSFPFFLLFCAVRQAAKEEQRKSVTREAAVCFFGGKSFAYTLREQTRDTYCLISWKNRLTVARYINKSVGTVFHYSFCVTAGQFSLFRGRKACKSKRLTNWKQKQIEKHFKFSFMFSALDLHFCFTHNSHTHTIFTEFNSENALFFLYFVFVYTRPDLIAHVGSAGVN